MAQGAALLDGSRVSIRQIRQSDEGPMFELLRDMSSESRYFRFCGYSHNLAGVAQQWSNIDGAEGFGLVVTAGPREQVVAHAMYIVSGEARAEVAFEVADHFHGLGVGTILMHALAEHAASVGITSFEATVLAANHRMIEVFRDSGFEMTTRIDHGSERVELAIGRTGRPAGATRFLQEVA